MSVSMDLRHIALRTKHAARRRRFRLLSASDNGAIVEYDNNTKSFSSVSPSHRIPIPPRYTLTRPKIMDYYKTVTGTEPIFAQRDVREEDYNYSWFTPVGIKDENRKKTHNKFKRRLHEAIIASKIPLSEVHEGVKGVFDSGHLYSPIRRQLPPKQSQTSTKNTSAEITSKEETSHTEENKNINENKDESIILIRPITREILSEVELARVESLRVAPKGREWDRQYALRHTIGPTAQEIIIDYNIDSRYRRPGDYVRRNGRGEIVDAQGHPMRSISIPR